MNPHGQLFVAGRLAAGAGPTFRAVSPLDGRTLAGEFQTAGATEVDQAMAAAADAVEAYAGLLPAARAAFLERLGEELLALGDPLIERCHLETGLGRDRLTGERARTVNQLRLFAGLAREGSWVDARIDTAQPDRPPIPKPDLRRMLVPLGPVVVFGSSNFPLAFSVAGGDTASALAAGCPVVVKAHRAHPGTSEAVASAVVRAVAACGLPPGVFSMLHGRGAGMGVALVKHPATRAVGFTGSRAAGRALFDAAASRPDPIPVFAEMSSLNPVFLLPGALARRGPQIAAGLVNSFTLGVGQFCTKPGLVLARQGPDLDAFERELAQRVEAALPATMLQDDIRASFQQGAAAAAAVPGVERLGEARQAADPARTQGRPLVLRTSVAAFRAQPRLAEEVFGPFTLVVEAASEEELLQAARALEGQLTATVQAEAGDLACATALCAVLREKAGRLVYNGFPTGVEVCPSMHHGGPYPATTDARFTSVGTAAIQRFARPVCYQAFPAELLPEELREGNPRGLWRLVNGELQRGLPGGPA